MYTNDCQNNREIIVVESSALDTIFLVHPLVAARLNQINSCMYPMTI